MVAQDPEAFAQAVASLLADPARREIMGERARKLCSEHYTWGSRDPEIVRLFNLTET
jgi:glycosyltransferase involved in cell wall biosynthesis